MKYSFSHIFGAVFAVPIALIVGFISINFFAFDQWIDSLVFLFSYIGSYIPIQRSTSAQYLKEVQLTRSEYKYVRQHLKEAQPKIKILLRQYTKIRSISDFRNVNEINRLARTIYKTVQRQPRKFFKVDSFFFSHLDNTVNLIDQYMFLVRMPHKTTEDIRQLNAAKITLEELKRTLQADLKQLNKDDFEQMAVEVDLAKLHQPKELEHLPLEQVPVIKKERIVKQYDTE